MGHLLFHFYLSVWFIPCNKRAIPVMGMCWFTQSISLYHDSLILAESAHDKCHSSMNVHIDNKKNRAISNRKKEESLLSVITT